MVNCVCFDDFRDDCLCVAVEEVLVKRVGRVEESCFFRRSLDFDGAIMAFPNKITALIHAWTRHE
jgi:hypothetical protein